MISSEPDPTPAYPVMMNLTGRRCVIIGGGKVACRKLKGLLTSGARVTLIAPVCLNPPVDDHFEWLRRIWRPGDLAGAALAFAATDDEAVNRAVAEEAAAAKIPVNLATAGEAGDFQLPAVRRVGAVTLAVGTNGKSPALSAIIADLLTEKLGEEWQVILELASVLRERALTGHKPEEYNQSILRHLLEADLERLIIERREDDIDRLLQQVCGMDCSLKELGIELPGKPS